MSSTLNNGAMPATSSSARHSKNSARARMFKLPPKPWTLRCRVKKWRDISESWLKKKAGLVGPTHSFFTIEELGGFEVPKFLFSRASHRGEREILTSPKPGSQVRVAKPAMSNQRSPRDWRRQT